MDTRLTLEAVKAMVVQQRRKAEQRQRLEDTGSPARRRRRFRRETARGRRFVAEATR